MTVLSCVIQQDRHRAKKRKKEETIENTEGVGLAAATALSLLPVPGFFSSRPAHLEETHRRYRRHEKCKWRASRVVDRVARNQ